jgi:hypothetical protein
MKSRLKYNEAALQDQFMSSEEFRKMLRLQLEFRVSKSAEPSRYTIIESQDNKGRWSMQVVDNNKDAIFHESQTGDLAKIRLGGN